MLIVGFKLDMLSLIEIQLAVSDDSKSAITNYYLVPVVGGVWVLVYAIWKRRCVLEVEYCC